MNDTLSDIILESIGLTKAVQIFDSAIEINTYIPHPDGGYWNGEKVFRALIAYGAQCERERREAERIETVSDQ